MKIAYIPNPYGANSNSPKLLVIHSMGELIDTDGEDYTAQDYLKALKISCHYLVTPSGIVIKTREEYQGSYHAKGYNSDSIGIEILVKGLHDYYTFLEAIKTRYYTDQQYAATVELCREILKRYPGIKVVRHSDLSPDRKYDPGPGLNWGQFLHDIGYSE